MAPTSRKKNVSSKDLPSKKVPSKKVSSKNESYENESYEDQLLSAVCAIIQQRRMKLGLSKQGLSAKSGLHRSYIGAVERGGRNIAMINLSRLALAMNLRVSKLVSLAEKAVEKGEQGL